MAHPGGDGDPAEMDERAELLRRVRGALGSGEISRADLVAILREGRSAAPGRIGATQVLSGLGAAVIVLGLTLIYARAFTAMADRAQLTTPFIFPLAASGLFVVVVRGGRPLWEREAAAFVVLATLGAALAASYAGTAGIDAWAWGTVAAAVVVGAALAMLGSTAHASAPPARGSSPASSWVHTSPRRGSDSDRAPFASWRSPWRSAASSRVTS